LATIDQPTDSAPARSAPANDLLLFGVIVSIFSFIVALIFHNANPSPTVDDVKLGDLLTISIGISSVVVGLIIAYLSSGRTADVFSEIGDAVPFFMEQAGLMPAVTSNSVLSAGPIADDADNAFQKKLNALDEMRSLRTASGRYLSKTSKRRFIPEDLVKTYEDYLENDIDRVMAQKYIFTIGIPAVFSLILLYTAHYDGQASGVRLFAHGFAIATIGFNGCGAFYFLRLSKVRERLQKAVACAIQDFCNAAKDIAPATVRGSEERSAATAGTLRARAARILQREPDPDPAQT
jgi:hypothetical protein